MRAIPENNLAYPVLVTLGQSSGSGFYVVANGILVFVTAKHVLFDKDTGKLHHSVAVLISYSVDLEDDSPNVVELQLDVLTERGLVKSHKSHDVAIIKVGVPSGSGSSGHAGTLFRNRAKGGICVVTLDTFKRLDEVLVSNDVIIFGYPVSLALARQPQIDFNRPLLRRGIVAAKNSKEKTIILDCPVYPGNSGGVALEITIKEKERLYRAIGVVSEFVPSIPQVLNQLPNKPILPINNSGYSIIEPMDHVLELIDELAST